MHFKINPYKLATAHTTALVVVGTTCALSLYAAQPELHLPSSITITHFQLCSCSTSDYFLKAFGNFPLKDQMS